MQLLSTLKVVLFFLFCPMSLQFFSTHGISSTLKHFLAFLQQQLFHPHSPLTTNVDSLVDYVVLQPPFLCIVKKYNKPYHSGQSFPKYRFSVTKKTHQRVTKRPKHIKRDYFFFFNGQVHLNKGLNLIQANNRNKIREKSSYANVIYCLAFYLSMLCLAVMLVYASKLNKCC